MAGPSSTSGSPTCTSSSTSSLHDLPDDVLALVSVSLHHRDLLHLSFTSSKLHAICSSDKLWMPHCASLLGSTSHSHILPHWRSALASAKALFRFLISVKPLVGIWVHQNPELGNLVYVTWGFVSVVACRIIPQELGPNGFDTGLLWAPVFEILGNADGTLAFFLHGRERDQDFFYPGRFRADKDSPSMLLLEAEPLLCDGKPEQDQVVEYSRKLSTPALDHSDDSAGEEQGKDWILSKARTLKGKKKYCVSADQVSFRVLTFGDRRRLLEELAPQLRIPVPKSACGPLFASARKMNSVSDNGKLRASPINTNGRCGNELTLMAERRSAMLSMYASSAEEGLSYKGAESASLVRCMCTPSDCQVAVNGNSVVASQDRATANGHVASVAQAAEGKSQTESLKTLGFAQFVRTKMKQIVGKSSAQEFGRTNSPSASEKKRMQLQEFLKQGQAVGLRLQARKIRLNFYRAWPIMNDNRFALYKIPEQKPTEGREHAGLWGGTFGWPPGLPVQDKPGTPLFFLLLSYDESEEGRLLIATKVLEGTHYVSHPNGSAMFIAKMSEPSSEHFPFDKDSTGNLLNIVQSYHGEGIANGYGFRYPGSKPGDLFIFKPPGQPVVLAFVWRESRAILSLQRMDLQSLLEKGERVAALPPVSNFAYLTKSYSNVFAGYSGATATRKCHESTR